MKKTLSLSAIMLMTAAPSLAQDIILLDEIVVEGVLARTELWKTGSTLDKLNSLELGQAPASSVTTILKGIPGVTTTQSGAFGGTTYLSVRGLPSAYIKTMKDGIDVTDPTAIKTEFGDLGEVTTSSLDSISLLKGTQSAIFGSSAIAGVMELKSIDLENAVDGFHQNIDVLLGSHGTRAGSYKFTQVNKKTRLGFTTSAFSTDGISSASTKTTNPETGLLNNEADSFKNDALTVVFSTELTDNFQIGATLFKETSFAEFDEISNDYQTPIDGTTDEYKTRDSLGASVFAKYSSGNWAHKTSVSSYSVKRILTQPTQTFFPASKDVYDGKRLSAQHVSTGQLAHNLTVSVGADTEKETAKSSAISGGEKSASTNGIFIEAQYLPSQKWSIVANLRHDDHENFGGFDSYRVSTSYKLSDETVIRIQQASGFRAPSMGELYDSYPDYDWYGNPNLKPETFTTNEITLNHAVGDKGMLTLTAFETKFDTRISSGDTTYYNEPANSSVSGSEVGLHMPLDEDTKFSLAFTNLTKKNMTGDRSAGQTFNFALGHNFSEQLSGNLQVISVSDQPLKSGKARDDYRLLNVGLKYNINKSLNVYGKIENLSDFQYETEPGYSSPGRTVLVGISASF